MEETLTAARDQAEEAVHGLPADLVKYALLALVLVILVVVARRVLARRKKRGGLASQPSPIDVLSLGEAGPPPGAAVLEFYNVPVRLAAVVIAPAGRVRALPTLDKMPDVYEALLPGLAQVVATHRPLIRRWPGQLSSRGFAHTFFAQARLPGEGGKGTPWTSAAGVFKVEGQPMMAGLVMRTETPSSHGQAIIEREAQWLNILRARQKGASHQIWE